MPAIGAANPRRDASPESEMAQDRRRPHVSEGYPTTTLPNFRSRVMVGNTSAGTAEAVAAAVPATTPATGILENSSKYSIGLNLGRRKTTKRTPFESASYAVCRMRRN